MHWEQIFFFFGGGRRLCGGYFSACEVVLPKDCFEPNALSDVCLYVADEVS